MDYVNLGKTGLKVSRICLGCMTFGTPATGAVKAGSHAWALSEEDSQPFFRQALELGINFFDTANVYSRGESERILGRFLKTNTRREATVIATKLNGVMRDEPNGRGLSRKSIFFELDESLRRLQTDYVDLYQIHRWMVQAHSGKTNIMRLWAKRPAGWRILVYQEATLLDGPPAPLAGTAAVTPLAGASGASSLPTADQK